MRSKPGDKRSIYVRLFKLWKVESFCFMQVNVFLTDKNTKLGDGQASH
jgi:hypothetical protein